MKKWVVLAAALASLLTVAGLSSALAGAAVAPANGNDVILPDGNVYELGADGAYHLIPDVATANAMRLDWNNLQSMDELDGPVGSPIVGVVVLSNARVSSSAAAKAVVVPANGTEVLLPSGSLYQQDSEGIYHLIPDVTTANAMKVNWNNLVTLDELDGPEGVPFQSLT